jgi:hypothetical protein
MPLFVGQVFNLRRVCNPPLAGFPDGRRGPVDGVPPWGPPQAASLPHKAMTYA